MSCQNTELPETAQFQSKAEGVQVHLIYLFTHYPQQSLSSTRLPSSPLAWLYMPRDNWIWHAVGCSKTRPRGCWPGSSWLMFQDTANVLLLPWLVQAARMSLCPAHHCTLLEREDFSLHQGGAIFTWVFCSFILSRNTNSVHESGKRQGFAKGRQSDYFYCKSFHHSKFQLTFLKTKSIIRPSG